MWRPEHSPTPSYYRNGRIPSNTRPSSLKNTQRLAHNLDLSTPNQRPHGRIRHPRGNRRWPTNHHPRTRWSLHDVPNQNTRHTALAMELGNQPFKRNFRTIRHRGIHNIRTLLQQQTQAQAPLVHTTKAGIRNHQSDRSRHQTDSAPAR